jgi:O-acetyl-ADP-ribose deacetylase
MNDSPILKTFLSGHVSVLVGDITKQHVDAIVNAANAMLLGGGGVDGDIHDKGGPQILEECREIRRTLHPQGLPVGEAVITSAGRLPARHVIHTVGPMKGAWGDRDAEKLADCYRNSIALAAQHNLRSIAFPAISTGIYAYPQDQAALVASEAIQSALADYSVVEEVRLVFYTPRDAQIFLENHKFTAA